MRKLWLVACHEYLRCARTKGFILLTLGLPALIVAAMAVVIVTASRSEPMLVGYVDQAGVIRDPAGVVSSAGEDLGPDPEQVLFQAFPDLESGRAAVSRGDVSSLFVLSPDYRATGRVDAYYWSRPPATAAVHQFESLVRANLVSDLTPEIQARLLRVGSGLTLRSLEGQGPEGGYGFGSVVVPGVLALFFTFSLMASVGYLLQAVTEEKENRTMEILATSVSADQLIVGKTVGLVALVLTQLLTWIAVSAAALAVATHYLEPPGDLQVSGRFLVVAALYFVPSFVLAAGMVISIGAVVTDFQQGQQITGVLTMLFLLPIFFMALIFQNPDSPVLVALTLFPTTSLTTVAFRWGVTQIPLWQLAAGWVLLLLAAAGMVMVAPRIFRRGMLRYGTRLSLRSALQAARSKGV